MKLWTKLPSPLGELLLASDGLGLTGLWLPGQKYYAAGLERDALRQDNLPVFVYAQIWLEDYFSGKRLEPQELLLTPRGTSFQRLVWETLLDIPQGQTATYGELAQRVAARMERPSMSAQAVGGAVGRNPISIIIPCHRVVGADGDLTGYAGGLEAKKYLLRLEGAER